jgi:hypothetical protein
VAESTEVHPVMVLGLGDLACSAVRKTLAQFDRGETAKRRQLGHFENVAEIAVKVGRRVEN